MTFRVITGNTYQGKTKVEGADKLKELATRQVEPSPRTQSPLTQPLEAAPVGQLLDRLEALSFTFEALNASSRTYAAEAVLETLARMERRDLQALAAIEAFASALKTVSQHLAGLRNAVQATAHETAIGLDHIGERLTRLEQKTGFAAGAEAGAMLDGIAGRLAGIEALVAEPAPPAGQFDAGPITEMLEAIAQRLARLEQKAEHASGGEALDVGPINAALETIARRVSRIENKLAATPAVPAPAIDIAPINAALEIVARRVLRIEKKLDEPVAAPTFELDATPLNDALDTIAQRVADLEHKVESGVDGHSIAACLLAIGQRLGHIETGLGMTLSAVAPVAAPAAAIDPIPEPAPATIAEPVAAAAAPQPPIADEAGGARQRVDLLLEQVFRVLSR